MISVTVQSSWTDDGRAEYVVHEVPEMSVVPGVGVELYQREGLAELIPWWRVWKIEREGAGFAAGLQPPTMPIAMPPSIIDSRFVDPRFGSG